jgi:hypothetical protein
MRQSFNKTVLSSIKHHAQEWLFEFETIYTIYSGANPALSADIAGAFRKLVATKVTTVTLRDSENYVPWAIDHC